MNVVEQDFELGFNLFKTPASFLINTNLILCASFHYGGSERYHMVLVLDRLRAFMDS